MDGDDVPKIFANRVIGQIVDHLFGGQIELQPQDYVVLRDAFRRMGGNWESLTKGDIKQFEKLLQLASAFGSKKNNQEKRPFILCLNFLEQEIA